jgi:hypothetical protein
VNGIILAIVATLVNNIEPIFIANMPDMASCQKAARQANENDPRLKMPEVRAMGPRYVCLKAESDA